MTNMEKCEMIYYSLGLSVCMIRSIYPRFASRCVETPSACQGDTTSRLKFRTLPTFITPHQWSQLAVICHWCHWCGAAPVALLLASLVEQVRVSVATGADHTLRRACPVIALGPSPSKPKASALPPEMGLTGC